MDLRTFITQSADQSGMDFAGDFSLKWTRKRLNKGTHLCRQGQHETGEFIVLEGCLASTICDQDGKEVCVGLYVGLCVVTPNIARTRDGVSLVSISATTDVSLARLETGQLTNLMVSSETVRHWANAALRDALSRKADREWCLAALRGADRLNWFRERFPEYEGIFAHMLIASFLGITPVTMSRLRANDRQ